jgi:hypothetical protein
MGAAMRFSQSAVNGLTCYLTVTDPVASKVFDWNSNTWVNLSSAVTPAVACSVASLGGRSIYSGNVDLTVISPDTTPRDIVVTMYQQAGYSRTPFTDSSFTTGWPLRVCAGQKVSDDPNVQPFTVDVTCNLTTTNGTSAHLTVELTRNGVTVPIHTMDSAATCSIVVTQDATSSAGARMAQFSLSTSDVGAANVSHRFEAEYASPGFASNKGFTAVASVTTKGVTYTGSCKFTTY